MCILMLAHRIPYPPHTGDKVRAYHVARHLAQRHGLALALAAPCWLSRLGPAAREASAR